MNDWEKEFWAVINTVTATVEEWVEEIEQTITAVSTTVEEEVATEWEWFWQDWSILWEEVTAVFTEFDPDTGDGHDEANSPPSSPPPRSSVAPWLSMDWEMGLNPYLPPTADHQPACQGCQHYHGFVYGGKLLVCGMHPYGSETDDCPDWEGSDANPI